MHENVCAYTTECTIPRKRKVKRCLLFSLSLSFYATLKESSENWLCNEKINELIIHWQGSENQLLLCTKESHSSTPLIWSKNCCEIIDTINPSISLSAGSFMCHFYPPQLIQFEIMVELSNQNIFIAPIVPTFQMKMKMMRRWEVCYAEFFMINWTQRLWSHNNN